MEEYIIAEGSIFYINLLFVFQAKHQNLSQHQLLKTVGVLFSDLHIDSLSSLLFYHNGKQNKTKFALRRQRAEVLNIFEKSHENLDLSLQTDVHEHKYQAVISIMNVNKSNPRSLVSSLAQVLVSQGYCNKLLQTWCLKVTAIYSLTWK